MAATGGGAIALHASPAIGLLFAALALFVGSIFCFRAMETTEIRLPGRGAEFWRWAISTDKVYLSHAVSEYLRELQLALIVNRGFNKKTGFALRRAKQAGIVATPAALIASLVAWKLGL